MNKLSVLKFSVNLPHDLVIKLEAERETLEIKARSKMIEKCIRYYFDNKVEENDVLKEINELRSEIKKIKEKIYLL